MNPSDDLLCSPEASQSRVYPKENGGHLRILSDEGSITMLDNVDMHTRVNSDILHALRDIEDGLTRETKALSIACDPPPPPPPSPTPPVPILQMYPNAVPKYVREEFFYCVSYGREIGVCFGESKMRQWTQGVDSPKVQKFSDWKSAKDFFDDFIRTESASRVIGYIRGDDVCLFNDEFFMSETGFLQIIPHLVS